MKVTIIGGGHIGGACALGLKDVAAITVVTRRMETLAKFEGTGVNAILNKGEAFLSTVQESDVVMFCVKTAQMREAVDSLKSMLKGKTVVSMAAQVDSAQMQEMIGEGVQLAYVIPNTAIAYKQSMTFISSVSASEATMRMLEELFNTAGETVVVPLDMLPAGISLASCGLGYALNYIAAASRGGEKLGFSREDAVRIVTQTVLGAAIVQGASEDAPEDEVRKVATPGGLTEKGVKAMEDAGFSTAVIAGLCPD